MARALFLLGFQPRQGRLQYSSTEVERARIAEYLSTLAPRQMAPVMSFPADLATRITRGVGTQRHYLDTH